MPDFTVPPRRGAKNEVGELACGNLRQRSTTIIDLRLIDKSICTCWLPPRLTAAGFGRALAAAAEVLGVSYPDDPS